MQIAQGRAAMTLGVFLCGGEFGNAASLASRREHRVVTETAMTSRRAQDDAFPDTATKHG